MGSRPTFDPPLQGRPIRTGLIDERLRLRKPECAGVQFWIPVEPFCLVFCLASSSYLTDSPIDVDFNTGDVGGILAR